MNNLLEIWDLEEDDVLNLPAASSGKVDNQLCDMDGQKPTLLLPLVASISKCSDVKHCDGCQAANSLHANWCIECGTAFIPELSAELLTDRQPQEEHVNRREWHAVQTEPQIRRNHPLNELDFSKPSMYGYSKHTCDSPCFDGDMLCSHCIANSAAISTSKETSAWRKPCSRRFEQHATESKVPAKPSSLHANTLTVEPVEQKDEYGDLDLCTTILNCPSEILIQIFSYMNHLDLFKCLLVCRTFYCIASDRTFWKSITLQRIKSLTRHSLEQVASKSPLHLTIIDCKGLLQAHDIVHSFERMGKLKSLTIEMSAFGAHMCDVMLLSAADYCKQLVAISIDWVLVSEATIKRMVQTCKFLEELSIKHPAVSCSAIEVLVLLHHDQIRKLNLESTFVTSIFAATEDKKMPVLESFTALFDVVDREIIRRLSYKFPALDSLYIHCTSNSKVCTREAAEELLNISLSVLYFKLPEKCSFDVVTCCTLSQFSLLRHLGIDCLGDEALSVLCQGKLHLETLDVSGSYVSDKCFSSILSGSFCSSLQCFKINNCDGINDAAVQKTVKSFSNKKATTMAEDISFFICSCCSSSVAI